MSLRCKACRRFHTFLSLGGCKAHNLGRLGICRSTNSWASSKCRCYLENIGDNRLALVARKLIGRSLFPTCETVTDLVAWCPTSMADHPGQRPRTLGTKKKKKTIGNGSVNEEDRLVRKRQIFLTSTSDSGNYLESIVFQYSLNFVLFLLLVYLSTYLTAYFLLLPASS